MTNLLLKQKSWYGVLLTFLFAFWLFHFSKNTQGLFQFQNIFFITSLSALLIFQTLKNRRGFWLLVVFLVASYSLWVIYSDLLLEYFISMRKINLYEGESSKKYVWILTLKFAILVCANGIVWIVRPKE